LQAERSEFIGGCLHPGRRVARDRKSLGVVLMAALHRLQFRMALYAEFAGNTEIAEARKATLRNWMSAIGTSKTTHKDASRKRQRNDSDQISRVFQAKPAKKQTPKIPYDEDSPEFKNDVSLFQKSMAEDSYPLPRGSSSCLLALNSS
jgi:hypothetical protein